MTELPKTVKMLQNDLKRRFLVMLERRLDMIDKWEQNNPEKTHPHADELLKTFSNKLLPNETTIAGDKENPLEIKLYDKEQLARIAERVVNSSESKE